MSPFTPAHMNMFNVYLIIMCCTSVSLLILKYLLRVHFHEFLAMLYLCAIAYYSYSKLMHMDTKPAIRYIDMASDDDDGVDDVASDKASDDGADDDGDSDMASDDGDSSSDYNPDEDDVYNYYYG